jgi:hypothetical protein
VVSFTPPPLYSQGKSPWDPLDRRLGGPQIRSGRGGEEKNSQEELIATQIIKKFTAFYGGRRIINVFTKAPHCSHPESDESSPQLPIQSNFSIYA